MALDEATRVRLGAQPDTTPDVLHALVADESVTVRAALALNPAAPAETNAALARDADDRVRALLARKLSMLAPALSEEAQSRLRRETLATLTALAEDETVRAVSYTHLDVYKRQIRNPTPARATRITRSIHICCAA